MLEATWLTVMSRFGTAADQALTSAPRARVTGARPVHLPQKYTTHAAMCGGASRRPEEPDAPNVITQAN